MVVLDLHRPPTVLLYAQEAGHSVRVFPPSLQSPLGDLGFGHGLLRDVLPVLFDKGCDLLKRPTLVVKP